MTCPALVPLALCAALGGPDPSATGQPPMLSVAEAPGIYREVSLRRHRYRYRYHRHARAPRAPRVVIVREPAPVCTPAAELPPQPRLVRLEIILSPAAMVRAGFDALRGAP